MLFNTKYMASNAITHNIKFQVNYSIVQASSIKMNLWTICILFAAVSLEQGSGRAAPEDIHIHLNGLGKQVKSGKDYIFSLWKPSKRKTRSNL